MIIIIFIFFILSGNYRLEFIQIFAILMVISADSLAKPSGFLHGVRQLCTKCLRREQHQCTR